MRTFSQSVSTRLLSSLQVCKVLSLSQQHRHGSRKSQVHTNQYAQVPIVRLVPRTTLLNTVQHIPHGMRPNDLPQNMFSINTLSEMMSATIPSQWNFLQPLTLVPSAQRNKTMLTSKRDQSSRRRALKAASSHELKQYP